MPDLVKTHGVFFGDVEKLEKDIVIYYDQQTFFSRNDLVTHLVDNKKFSPTMARTILEKFIHTRAMTKAELTALLKEQYTDKEIEKIFALVPEKKQSKTTRTRKKKIEDTLVEEPKEEVKEEAPAKPKRKRTTKAKITEEVKSVEEKPKRTRKKKATTEQK